MIAGMKNCNQEQERTDCRNRELPSAERKTDYKSGKLTSMEMRTESRKPGLQSASSFLRWKIAVRREKLTAAIERNINLLIAEIRFCYQLSTYYI